MSRQRDQGSATVEIALALPALVTVVAIALWGIAAAAAQLTCIDAVRAGAIAAARGEPLPEVRAQILSAAPPGSDLVLTQTADSTCLTLEAPFRPSVHLPLPALMFHITAETPTEPALR